MSNEAFTLFLTDYGPGILIILVMIVLSAFFLRLGNGADCGIALKDAHAGGQWR